MRIQFNRIHLAILGATLALGSVSYASAKEIPMSDALAKSAEIQGTTINIKDCSIVHAARDFLACGTPGGTPISVMIESATLNDADLQTALLNCGSATASTTCDADVTGIASRNGSHIVLTEADIFWKSGAEQRTAHDAATIPAGAELPLNAHVVINNCMIAGANREFLSCIGKDQTTGTHVLINAENLSDIDMQRAHRHCSGWQASSACGADVVGKATKVGVYYKLEHPSIFWKEAQVALN